MVIGCARLGTARATTKSLTLLNILMIISGSDYY